MQGVPGVERPGPEADHSPPTSAEVKNTWIYTSIPPYVSMAWCLAKYAGNFTFVRFEVLVFSIPSQRASVASYG
jgi:hypothetical protein